MTPAPLDLRGLPRGPGPSRGFVVWGAWLLVAIEATVIASMVTSYFYLGVVTDGPWPPPAMPPPDLLLSTLGLGALLASLLPLRWASRALARGDLSGWRRAAPVGLLLVLAELALAAADLATKPHDWAADAYTSITWTLSGYQLLHVLTLALLVTVLCLAVWRGRLDLDRRAVLEAATIYWGFVAASAVPSWLTVTVSPYLLGTAP